MKKQMKLMTLYKNIPVINKKVQTNWKAVTLLDAECALTDNGFQYTTKFFK